MKKNIIYMASAVLIGTAMLASCSNDNGNVIENGKAVVTAKAVVGDAATTRVSYTEQGNTENSYKAGVTAAWESGDVLQAFETNSGTVTTCTFSTTGTTAQANFTSTNAAATSSSTEWKALYGTGATVAGTTITCGYDGQDGTLTNLKKYDYMIATGSGTTPSFDFSTGTRLSYFIRLKLPASIKTIELNTSGTWTVTSTANTAPTPTTSTVTTVTLGTASTAGDIAYIAVPAIDYSTVGLIVTIFNTDKNKSQGKVLVTNLSSKGGSITTLDMSGLTLMDRPTTTIDLGTTLGKWAPFNVGAKPAPTNATEAYGNYYMRGLTEPFDKNKTPYNGTEDISGTRYDVARVKWGRNWKMPTKTILESLITNNEVRYYKIGSLYKVSPYNNIPNGIAGNTYTANGNTLFLPAAGGSSYSNSTVYKLSDGYYWSSSYDDGNSYLSFGDQSTSIVDASFTYGFSVRPIYSE